MKKIRYAQKDYELSSLPATRKDEFFDIYRHNFSYVLKAGSLLLLFGLPLLVFVLFMDIGNVGINPSVYDEETLYNVKLMWDILLHGGVLVGLVFFLFGFAGVSRILHLLIYQEGISFWHDFFQGVKENFVPMLLQSLWLMVLYAGSYAVCTLVAPFILGIGLSIIFVLLPLPIYLWSIASIGVYETKFFEHTKNGLFFAFRNILWTLPFLLLGLLPFFAYYLPFNSYLYAIIKFAVFVLLMLFYYPGLFLIGSLFAQERFDRFINKEHYPEAYRQGLYEEGRQ